MTRQNGAEIARQQRRMRVLQAKVEGASVREIARRESVSLGVIQKDVQRALGELAKEHVGHADQVRALQMERLNALLETYYPLALTGDTESANMTLRIIDKISQINGVIPDKSLVSIQQNSFNANDMPVTFIIENANDNDSNPLQASATVLEARASNIQP